jgi:uncharacterized membrane-anchored protein YhcB (DUF1043 family)
MDMEWIWVIAIVMAAAAGGAGGFFIGRSRSQAVEQIRALRSEVDRQQTQLSAYRQEVEAHLDKTATLFVDMAASYKAVFEHLAEDYERLSDGTARAHLKARIGTLLLDDARAQALLEAAGSSAAVPTPDAATEPTPATDPDR